MLKHQPDVNHPSQQSSCDENHSRPLMLLGNQLQSPAVKPATVARLWLLFSTLALWAVGTGHTGCTRRAGTVKV